MPALQRRAISVPGLAVAAVVGAVTVPLWLPVATVADLVRGRWRLPTVRLGLFGVCWAWLELAGVSVAGLLWLTGQRHNRRAHYALQRWWAANVLRAMTATTGLKVQVRDAEALRPGPVVVLCRHASLADSLLSAWAITSLARMRPRYVLKKELLADPCLDIVGNRLANYFLDRDAADSSAELSALTALTTGMGPDDAGVIFPEGTRASDAKRAKALARIGERDPQRAGHLAALRHVLPPRPAGSAAMLDGTPGADVVLGWHVGFDGFDTFGGILRKLARRPAPVRLCFRRIGRAEVPAGEDFTAWLDQRWLELDDAVGALLEEAS